jgi:site-specific recombinase XerD
MSKRATGTIDRGLWEREPDVWWIRYRDADGKLHREKVGRKSAARSVLNKRREDRRVGTKLPDNIRYEGVRFSELADAIEVYAERHHRDSRNVKSRLVRIRPDFDGRVADSIKPDEIDQWLTENTSTPATSNRYRALFSLMFREALRNGKVKSNPARLVRQKHEDNAVIRWLTDEEDRALRDAIKKHHAAHMPELDIAVGTGMRLSEQFGLTWGQVDFVRREVRLPRTKNGAGRSIPMNVNVQSAFTQLKQRVRAAKKTDNVFAEFPRRWWEDALHKCGVSDFRWHDLRHTFCSRLAMNGVNLKVIQSLAGHKTIAMTARYAHLDDRALRSAVDGLESSGQQNG